MAQYNILGLILRSGASERVGTNLGDTLPTLQCYPLKGGVPHLARNQVLA
jgi:hypothetical protein